MSVSSAMIPRRFALVAAAALGALFALATDAVAGVNQMNGNFYISYEDVKVPNAGRELTILRTYNSNSAEIGWFGLGWASLYETRLLFSIDGSITVAEQGAGAKNLFQSASTGPAVEDAVAALVNALVKGGEIKTLARAEELQDLLVDNSEWRLSWAQKAIDKGWIEPAPPPVCAKLLSRKFGNQEIEVFENEIVRSLANGETQVFDRSGRLTAVRQRDGQVTNLLWSDNGRRLTFTDAAGIARLQANFAPDGRVVSISGPQGQASEYRYDGRLLIFARDAGANVYRYEYDENENMTAVLYADGTAMRIEYSPDTLMATRVTERHGGSLRYDYYDYDNPQAGKGNHYGTSVTREFDGRQDVSEYLRAATPDFGALYTAEFRARINGVLEKTAYNSCGYPTEMRRGDARTIFEYDDNCLMTRKLRHNGEEVVLEYHPDFKKITRVENREGWTNFAYNGYGDVVFAENSRGQSVSLIYEKQGRIAAMIDRSGRVLKFDYNEQGKPTKVILEGVGAIDVAYDEFGNVVRVESDAGHQMSLLVTQAFQNLLTLVKPSGVDFRM